ncbi:MAG: hypothetical protein JNN07_26260 [Verrucomicrobiales bacterium]|nr:hypothetical protein [Verrucomicrobiales bacterium]
MKLDRLQRRLLKVARGNPPSSAVPYAFEKRIMARLATSPTPTDPWLVWAVGLWRGTVPCLILLSGIALWNWQDTQAWDASSSSSDDLELAVVDAIDLSDNVED